MKNLILVSLSLVAQLAHAEVTIPSYQGPPSTTSAGSTLMQPYATTTAGTGSATDQTIQAALAATSNGGATNPALQSALTQVLGGSQATAGAVPAASPVGPGGAGGLDPSLLIAIGGQNIPQQNLSCFNQSTQCLMAAQGDTQKSVLCISQQQQCQANQPKPVLAPPPPPPTYITCDGDCCIDKKIKKNRKHGGPEIVKIDEHTGYIVNAGIGIYGGGAYGAGAPGGTIVNPVGGGLQPVGVGYGASPGGVGIPGYGTSGIGSGYPTAAGGSYGVSPSYGSSVYRGY